MKKRPAVLARKNWRRMASKRFVLEMWQMCICHHSLAPMLVVVGESLPSCFRRNTEGKGSVGSNGQGEEKTRGVSL